jgi:hypothetical protein
MSRPVEPEAMKKRIVNHMNQDHRRELIHYLRHWNKLSPSDARGSTMVDINLNEMRIATPGGQEHVVPFEPPMGSYVEARERLIQMDRQARHALGVELTLAEYATPTPEVALLAGPVALLPLGFLAKRYRLLEGPSWKDAVPLVVAILVGQAMLLDLLRLQRYDVDRWTGVWWKWIASSIFEGYGTWRRIDKLAREKKQKGKQH